MKRLMVIAMTFGVGLLSFSALAADGDKNLILVDKKTKFLRLAKYVDGHYELVKEYHATLGKVKGDKEAEGDLKTPEGIYFFNSKQTPPHLGAKFGKAAFHMNFPNPFDVVAGRTGSNIMLHATNEPERLKKDYDSEGCVVVNNEEILELSPFLRLNLTPILVFEEFKPEYMNPGTNKALVEFFESWVSDWENKRAESYTNHYHTDFVFTDKGNMTRTQYRAYKEQLNRQYATIKVNPENVMYFTHPKYSVVMFTQNYHSTLKGGGVGHASRGTKVLYIAEEQGALKIVAESFSRIVW